jgi:hypothetical protein
VSKGGCDIDSGNTYYKYLMKGVKEGLCSMSDVDARLFNSFRVRFHLGLFDSQSDAYWQYGTKNIGTEASINLNLKVAEESIVLLQHGSSGSSTRVNLLPLQQSDNLNIAVVGPLGDATRSMIQVDTGKLCPDGNFDCIESPFNAIAKLNANGTTSYHAGCGIISNDDSQIETAVLAAKQADVVVLAIGITSCGDWWRSPVVPKNLMHCHFNDTDGSRYLEAEGHDRETLDLPPIQQKLSTAILALNKPTIIILMHAGQIAIEQLLHLNHVTVVDAFYPGAMGGVALANLLFGQSNRWGKLPYTVYVLLFLQLCHCFLE